MQAFSICGRWGLLFIEVHELLVAVEPERRLSDTWASVFAARRLSSRGPQGSVVMADELHCSVTREIFPDQESNLCPLH